MTTEKRREYRELNRTFKIRCLEIIKGDNIVDIMYIDTICNPTGGEMVNRHSIVQWLKKHKIIRQRATKGTYTVIASNNEIDNWITKLKLQEVRNDQS